MIREADTASPAACFLSPDSLRRMNSFILLIVQVVKIIVLITYDLE